MSSRHPSRRRCRGRLGRGWLHAAALLLALIALWFLTPHAHALPWIH